MKKRARYLKSRSTSRSALLNCHAPPVGNDAAFASVRILELIIGSLTETGEGSSDSFIMRSGGVSKPMVDRMGLKVLNRLAVAADEQESAW